MKKLTKGIGLFILALFMVFSSFTTPVEAVNASPVTITYKENGKTYSQQWPGTYNFGMFNNHTDDGYTLTVNEDFTTSYSILAYVDTKVTVNANGKTVTYNGTNNGLFCFVSGKSEDAQFILNGGTYNIEGNKDSRLVSSLVSQTQSTNYGYTKLNGVTANFKNQSQSMYAGITAPTIEVVNSTLNCENSPTLVALYPATKFGEGKYSHSSLLIDNSTINGFGTGAVLFGSTNREDNGFDGASLWLKNDVKFTNNNNDIIRNISNSKYNHLIKFDESYTNNDTLKIYDPDRMLGAQITIGNTKENLKLESVNSKLAIKYVSEEDSHGSSKHYEYEGAFDATKATYTITGNTMTATYNGKSYTLTMNALDMILTGDSAETYNGLTVKNSIPGTTAKVTYTKGSDPVSNGTNLDPTGTQPSLEAADNYKVTLSLYVGNTKVTATNSEMAKEFKVLGKDTDLSSATFSKNDDNTIKATIGSEGNTTEARIISISAKDATAGSEYSDSNIEVKNLDWLKGKRSDVTSEITYEKKVGDTWQTVTGKPSEAGIYRAKLVLKYKENGSDKTVDPIYAEFEIKEANTTPDEPDTPTGDSDFNKDNYSVSVEDDAIVATDNNGNSLILTMNPTDGEYSGNGYDESLLNIYNEITPVTGVKPKISYLGINGTSYGPSTAAPSAMGSYQVTLTYVKDGKTYKIVKTFKIGPSSDDSLNDKYCKSTKGSNYAWSKEKQACVYKVVNTGSN